MNSSLSREESQEIEEKILAEEVKLLYVSPEKIISDWFLGFLDRVKVNLFAIDDHFAKTKNEFMNSGTLLKKIFELQIVNLPK